MVVVVVVVVMMMMMMMVMVMKYQVFRPILSDRTLLRCTTMTECHNYRMERISKITKDCGALLPVKRRRR